MRFILRAALYLSGSFCFLLIWAVLAPLALAQATAAQAKSSQAKQVVPCSQLLPGENPMTLSDARLFALGLPSQASLHQNPSRWASLLSHLGTHVCARGHALNLPRSAMGPRSGPGVQAVPDAPYSGCNAHPGSQCQNYLWAGNETVSSDGKGDRGIYREADFEVTVPTISHSPSNAEAAYWVGVGGNSFVTSGGTVLVQAGVITSVSGNGQYNESVVEVADNVPYYNLPLCRLRAGDTVYTYVESNYNNDGYDYFFMENLSANSCYNSCTVHTDNNSIPDTCGFSGGHSFNSDSATGECIVERVGGEYGLPLAQFNPSSNRVQMQYCDVNFTYINNQSHNYLIIENSSNQLMAGCGSINSTGTFPVIWYRST